jgi:tetratricopeptide (TPR) repeat protein
MGRYCEAEAVVAERYRLAEEAEMTLALTYNPLHSSIMALDRGHLSAAIDSATRVVEAPEKDKVDWFGNLVAHFLAGVAEARSGQPTAAEDHKNAIAKLSNRQPFIETFVSRSLEGEIALARGDLDRAEAAFASALPTGKMPLGSRNGGSFFGHNSPARDRRARVCRARGDAAGAIAEYRRLLTPSADQESVGVLEPRYVLELARLLDEVGDHAAARDEYRRFLDLWKYADPDLPELAEVRKRLEQLETTSQ